MPQPTRCNLSATVTVAAAAADKPGPPTFSSLAYSGATVPGVTATPRLKHDYVIDLAGMSLGKNAKANLDHDAAKRVGHVTGFENTGAAVQVTGVLSAATAEQEMVAKSAANGYEWEVSIEAALSKGRLLKADETTTVNGRQVSGPLYIFGKSTLTDIAFVSHGADDGNVVTIAATAAGVHTMTDFDKFVTSCGADPESITDEHRARLKTLYELEQGGTTTKTRKSFSEIAEDERKEVARVEAISLMGRDAMREAPYAIDKIEAATQDAIDTKMSTEKFELELLRALRTRSGMFQSRLAGNREDPKVLEAAICLSSGLPNIEKHYSPQVLEAVDRTGLRGNCSLQQMLLQTAHRNGYTCRAGERITVGNIRTVLEYCFPPVMARMGQFSTASLPNILGAVANKMILTGYMEEDMTWEEIAEVKPVSNFYTQNHYRMLDSLEYDEVGSGGTINHGTLGEETYTSTAKTYGKMLGITRTQIINDDLGAFNDLRTRLGRGAAKKFNNVFWTAFLDNSSFFTTALTNYIEGATTTLLTDGVGLGLAVKAFRLMTTPAADGSKNIGTGLNPSKVLVPPELEAAALTNYVNTNLGNVIQSGANIYQNRFRPVVQWRLSNSSYTGYSTTAWYMFGDTMRPMLVTFLNGQRSPTVESTDADFDTLGIQFRGYHDFGCDKSEYLAGIKSKGAA